MVQDQHFLGSGPPFEKISIRSQVHHEKIDVMVMVRHGHQTKILLCLIPNSNGTTPNRLRQNKMGPSFRTYDV